MPLGLRLEPLGAKAMGPQPGGSLELWPTGESSHPIVGTMVPQEVIPYIEVTKSHKRNYIAILLLKKSSSNNSQSLVSLQHSKQILKLLLLATDGKDAELVDLTKVSRPEGILDQLDRLRSNNVPIIVLSVTGNIPTDQLYTAIKLFRLPHHDVQHLKALCRNIPIVVRQQDFPTPELANSTHCHDESFLVELVLTPPRSPRTLATTYRLHAAVHEGNPQLVALLLEEEDNDEIDIPDAAGATPLYHAARHGHDDIVDILLKNGAKPNASEEKRPLSSAVSRGHTKTVQALLHSGASMSLDDLQLAATLGRFHTAKLLLQEYNDDDLHKAAMILAKAAASTGQTRLSDMVEKGNAPDNNQTRVHKAPIEVEYEGHIKRLQLALHSTSHPEQLRQVIENNINFIHYQDSQGQTALHMAARDGHALLVETLLDCGALPSALDNQRATPADLAHVRGHHDVFELIQKRQSPKKIQAGTREGSQKYLQLLECIVRGVHECRSDSESRRAQLEVVREVTSLLEAGTPLEHPGSHVTSALHLAITTSCTLLLPLLIAAGAPLTVSAGGATALQIAKFTPGITPWVVMVLARAMRHTLQSEMKLMALEGLDGDGDGLHEQVQVEMQDMIGQLEGEDPWRAKMKCCKGNPHLAGRIVEHLCILGAMTAAWLAWDAMGGVQVVSQAAIQTSIGQHHIVPLLVNTMGANPFVPSTNGVPLLHQLPPRLQRQLLQETLEKEHRSLYDKMLKKRRHANLKSTQDLLSFIVLKTFLHLEYEHLIEGEKGVSIQVVNCLLEMAMGERYLFDKDRMDILGKMRMWCGEGEGSQDNVGDYWDLQDFLRTWYCKTRNSFEHTDNKSDALQSLLQKAVKVCCEMNLPAFLFLLSYVAKVDMDEEIDQVCGSRPLHCAAIHGQVAIVTFLLHSGSCKTVKDRSGNTPAHCAFMVGQTYLGNLLLDGTETVANNHRKTPLDIRESFQRYLAQQSLGTAQDNCGNFEDRVDRASLTRRHLEQQYEEWKIKGGIENVLKEMHVDFTKGESATVCAAVKDLIKTLTDDVAHRNSLLEGDLVLLGSSLDDARLCCPDEYDFNLILKNINMGPQGINVEIRDDHNHANLQKYIRVSENGSSLCSNMVEIFYEIMKVSLTKMDVAEGSLSLVAPGIRKTQVGVSLCLAWMGEEFPLLLIDVDIVPTIEAPWPTQHPRPPLTSPDITNVYLSQLMNGQWRFSFGLAEGHIMKRLTTDQRQVFLACKLLIMSLKAAWWVPKEIKQNLTFWDFKTFRLDTPAGFVLKTSFFKELEEIDDLKKWNKNHLLERMKSVFARMCIDAPSPQYPRPVWAYFGGETQLPTFAFGAPDILSFLESLPDVEIMEVDELQEASVHKFEAVEEHDKDHYKSFEDMEDYDEDLYKSFEAVEEHDKDLYKSFEDVEEHVKDLYKSFEDVEEHDKDLYKSCEAVEEHDKYLYKSCKAVEEFNKDLYKSFGDVEKHDTDLNKSLQEAVVHDLLYKLLFSIMVILHSSLTMSIKLPQGMT